MSVSTQAGETAASGLTPTKANRLERLALRLAEAAEIEHGLMCCYLYAAFSLKRDESEGLSAAEVAAVADWRRTIVGIALEEMGHLGLVSNLFCALGLQPHFGRQNFPVAPGYHPADIIVRLAPFDMETIQHFVFLERPDRVKIADGRTYAHHHKYRRGEDFPHLTPGFDDYATVAGLYQSILADFEMLVVQRGESTVFRCSADTQIGPPDLTLPGLMTISSMTDVREAIHRIIVQGEGAADDHHASHFVRFEAIHRKYHELLAANPKFKPGRSAARNPVMRRPTEQAEGRVYIEEPVAAHVVDFANALYNHLIRLLRQAYGRHGRDPAEKRLLVDAAIQLMPVMSAAGELATTLPASAAHPGVNAGITFATLPGMTNLIQSAFEWDILAARTGDLAEATGALEGLLPRARELAEDLRTLSRRLANMDETAGGLLRA